MVLNNKIPFDLESTPLQIKTNSTVGSGELIWLQQFTTNNVFIEAVWIKFTSPVQYLINSCSSKWTELPVQPPDEVDKIWTIRKNTTNLNIECNGVEVLNYQFSDSSDPECVDKWGGDVVEKIKFYPDDTASDSYRGIPKGNEGVM